uniref:Alpha-type protein kinase domain-containing protein n=1 Tax=Chromera velia CCMP2878 TaxID=1169474 RepID=A0A0G4I9D3_9ALVE|eukprot:Cvel_2022.t1-p1 / transcript=Cvel_2022.t1 / gene=Cvel_2022 / organism=Chromera_velia_CCMP2878 / gene_product=Alpha-protein kinase vwkA, putative / transcript_product=Alpha-protein kinase vwkA, putative / location=Cvel_scaffold77:120784-123715(-) / protein_length=650 / sequence_SO=supercontig / SO=protein_coding / is_pseudo=false
MSFEDDFRDILGEEETGGDVEMRSAAVVNAEERLRGGDDVSEGDVHLVEEDMEKMKEELKDLVSVLKTKMDTGTATRDGKKTMDRLKLLKERIKAAEGLTKTARRTLERRTVETEALRLKRELEVADVFALVKEAEAIDLLFAVDSTGSMASHIAAVKEKIHEIVKRIRATNPSLSLRLGFIAYRDHSDGPKRVETLPFTSDVDDFTRFVGSVAATGGADEAEDIAGALQVANNFLWQQATKILFHIGDAPCHGSRFHVGAGDSYPGGCPRGVDIILEVKKLLMQENMSYFFGRLNASTDKMISVINAELPHGVSIETVDYGSAGKLVDVVTTAVRKSAFRTFSTIASRTATKSRRLDSHVEELLAFLPKEERDALRESEGAKEKKIPLSDAPVDWKTVPLVVATVTHIQKITRSEQLKEMIVDSMVRGKKTHKCRIQVAPRPFANGAIRYCYRGHCEIAKGGGGVERKPYVFKIFMRTGKCLNSLKSHAEQAEISAVAVFLADVFNRQVASPTDPKIEIITSYPVEIEDPMGGPAGEKVCCMEKELPDGGKSFKKFCSNTGFWDPEIFDPLLAKFVLWTVAQTKGFLIVGDLQGVVVNEGGKKKYVLTDPAVHSTDLMRFSNTNLGKKGVDMMKGKTEAFLRDWESTRA